MMGHNSTDENDRLAQAVFMDSLRQIIDGKASIASTMGGLAGVYKRLSDFGITKADVRWALDLRERDAPKVLAEMRRRLRIAGWFGHQLSRQLTLLDEDRTPIEDSAFDAGHAVATMRGSTAENPHDLSTIAGQAWQRGYNEGTALMNSALAEAMAKPAEGAAADRGDAPSMQAEADEPPAIDESQAEADIPPAPPPKRASRRPAAMVN